MIRRTLAAALLVGAALTATTAAPAEADDSCSPPLCGKVSNFTSNHMLIAAIGSSGSSGGTSGTCTFVWGTEACRTKTLPTGSTSGAGNGYKDVDGFTFTGTHFYYNGVYFPKNRYVRVYDPEYILCTKVPGLAPRCVN